MAQYQLTKEAIDNIVTVIARDHNVAFQKADDPEFMLEYDLSSLSSLQALARDMIRMYLQADGLSKVFGLSVGINPEHYQFTMVKGHIESLDVVYHLDRYLMETFHYRDHPLYEALAWIRSRWALCIVRNLPEFDRES